MSPFLVKLHLFERLTMRNAQKQNQNRTYMHNGRQFAEICKTVSLSRTYARSNFNNNITSRTETLSQHHCNATCFTKWTSIIDSFPRLSPPLKNHRINFGPICSRYEFVTRSIIKTNRSGANDDMRIWRIWPKRLPPFLRESGQFLLFLPQGSEQEQKGLPNAAHPSTHNKCTSRYFGEGLVRGAKHKTEDRHH